MNTPLWNLFLYPFSCWWHFSKVCVCIQVLPCYNKEFCLIFFFWLMFWPLFLWFKKISYSLTALLRSGDVKPSLTMRECTGGSMQASRFWISLPFNHIIWPLIWKWKQRWMVKQWLAKLSITNIHVGLAEFLSGWTLIYRTWHSHSQIQQAFWVDSLLSLSNNWLR